MNSRKSQKEATTKELAIGGGMFLLFLPVILLALSGIGFVIMAAIALLVFFQFDPSTILVIGLVYGSLFVVILVLLWKFWSRFRLLTGRWLGLRREKQRLAETIDTARLSVDMTDTSDMPLDDDFDSLIITDRFE